MIPTSRRSLFGFGTALLAAPAIVRVSALMPVSVLKYEPRRWLPYMATVEPWRVQPMMIVSETWWNIVMEGSEDRAVFKIVPDRLARAA